MADSKKTEFFKIANSQIFFIKISWIGPWVNRINWCEGHWCGSFSRLILRLCRTASWPYRLSHINALHINQSYQPKGQSMKFSQILFENWRFWKIQFFWVSHFDFFFSKKNQFFFCFIPMKISQRFLDIMDVTKFWRLPWFPAKNNTPQTLLGGVYDVQIKSLEINSLKLKKCRYNKLFRGWGRSLYYTKIQTGNANEHSLTCWQDNTLCRPQANNFLTEKRTCSSKDNVSSRNKPAISIQDISEQKAEQLDSISPTVF
jgi:hypothetical protein